MRLPRFSTLVYRLLWRMVEDLDFAGDAVSFAETMELLVGALA